MNIPVIYEDDWLLIADKPSGLLVIPASGNRLRTLTSVLNNDLKERNLSYRLHPCHRLDRQTSGLIIYAKGKSIQKKMMDEFRDKRIKKRYIAFVQGIPNEAGRISHPIEGLPAVTRYKVIEKRKNFSVVEVEPVTGRTNQIRIHFKQIKHPIVGEDKYAFRKDYNLRAKRLCLQAEALEFIHPVTKENIRVSIGLAKDLKEFLAVH